MNAGIHADAPLPAMKPDAWDRVLRTNLDGFYNVSHPLLMPMVRSHGGGRVVSISSIAGLAGNRGQANYAASKAGIIAATKSLAQELAKRSITVNCVAPGLIETDMIAGAPVEEIVKLIPMRRLGRPEEIAATVVVSVLARRGLHHRPGDLGERGHAVTRDVALGRRDPGRGLRRPAARAPAHAPDSRACASASSRSRPTTSFKVGEATVEIGASYLVRRQGLLRYLYDRHYPKNGLRYFFDNETKSAPLQDMSEIGPDQLPVPRRVPARPRSASRPTSSR